MPFITIQRRTPQRGRGVPQDSRRFALGTRSVADLVAPAAVQLARDHLRLDHQYTRTLMVTGYPRTVSPGWLVPLIDFEDPLEISLHVHPLETSQMVTTLTHKMVQLHSSRLMAARSGRLADPEREVAYEDAERLRDALQRGEERVFSVSLYILLRASSPVALEDLTRRVEAVLGSMLAYSRVALLEQDNGFRSCLPQGEDRLLVYRNLDTSSLATMFPFASGTLSMERGVLYGIARHNHSPVLFDPFDEGLENANLVVFARSGAGKSYFTKLMALRNLLCGVDFLVIDPEDEYRTLCSAVDGQYVRLAGSSGQHLNPFDLPPAVADLEGRDPLAEQVASLVGLMELMLAEPGQTLGAHGRALLDRALYQTYAAAGITEDPATHHRPAPILRDLHRSLLATPGEIAQSLATRLLRYVEGSLAGLFSEHTNVALDRRLVVFNLQAMEPELRPIGRPKPDLAERLRRLDVEERIRAEAERQTVRPFFTSPLLEKMLRPVLDDLGRLLRSIAGRFGVAAGHELGSKLRIARPGVEPAQFLGEKVATGLVGLTLFPLMSGLGVHPFGVWPVWTWVAGLVAGFLGPDWELERRLSARRIEVLMELPIILDMLAIATSAGLAMEQALDLVARQSRGAVAGELRQVVREMALGQRSTVEALEAMAERNDVPELTSFVGQLRVAHEQGIPLVQTLSAQAEALRERKRLRIVEEGGKASVRMILPVALFILPVLFVVLLLPAAIQLMQLGG